jgi:hypothetical protein
MSVGASASSELPVATTSDKQCTATAATIAICRARSTMRKRRGWHSRADAGHGNYCYPPQGAEVHHWKLLLQRQQVRRRPSLHTPVHQVRNAWCIRLKCQCPTSSMLMQATPLQQQPPTPTPSPLSPPPMYKTYIGRMADTDIGDHNSTSRPRAFEALALRPIYGGGGAAAQSISSSDLGGAVVSAPPNP